MYELHVTFENGKTENRSFYNEKGAKQALINLKNNGCIIINHEIIERETTAEETNILTRHSELMKEIDCL